MDDFDVITEEEELMEQLHASCGPRKLDVTRTEPHWITENQEQIAAALKDAERYRRLCTLVDSGAWFVGFFEPGLDDPEPFHVHDGDGISDWLDDLENVPFEEAFKALKHGT